MGCIRIRLRVVVARGSENLPAQCNSLMRRGRTLSVWPDLEPSTPGPICVHDVALPVAWRAVCTGLLLQQDLRLLICFASRVTSSVDGASLPSLFFLQTRNTGCSMGTTWCRTSRQRAVP